MDLRKPFFETMEKMMEQDPNIFILTGDLGFSFIENVQKRFPDRVVNVGIAEQNMIGMAAGMALAGKKPYVYSNAIFLLSRGHEFVRDDVAYNNLNVKLIGTGAAGFLGFTHNIGSEEHESNWLKGMPNIKQFYPKSEVELKEALLVSGPAYIRL